MYAHTKSEMCKFYNICGNKLCPFQHTINEQENQNSDDIHEKINKANEKEVGTKDSDECEFTDNFDEHEMRMESNLLNNLFIKI